MFAMSYGAWALGFGISFWQATAMTIIGVVISFLLVGIISIAGKRGNAPTMVLTRATFGVEGAKVPAALSWIATLGWEISLTTTAVLALSSTIEKLGWGSGVAPKIISTIVVVGLVVVAGIFGYDLIMRCQQVITIVTGVITVGFFILGWGFSGVFVGAFGASEAVSAYAIQYSHLAVGMSIFVMISMMCEKIQQSGGNMIIPMCQGLTGAIINIILDPLMIFGIGPFPEMGIRGAALATVIAYSLSLWM